VGSIHNMLFKIRSFSFWHVILTYELSNASTHEETDCPYFKGRKASRVG